jgi:transposase, IS5 family
MPTRPMPAPDMTSSWPDATPATASLHKAKRNQPLSGQQKHQNRLWSSVRSTVERVFGVLKQHYCLAKARYLGLKRNQARFMLAAMAYNLKRGVAAQAEMLTFAG